MFFIFGNSKLFNQLSYFVKNNGTLFYTFVKVNKKKRENNNNNYKLMIIIFEIICNVINDNICKRCKYVEEIWV